MTSPDLTALTPAGVPVRTMSFGSRVKNWEMYESKYGTVNIMSFVFPSCFMLPLTLHHTFTLCGSGIDDFGIKALTGQDVSKLFAISQGWPFCLAIFYHNRLLDYLMSQAQVHQYYVKLMITWRSLAVMSRAST